MSYSPRDPRARRPWGMRRAGWHGLYLPAIYGSRSASEISDILNLVAGVSGTDFTPSNVWHCDEEGDTAPIVDFLGNVSLVSQGAGATRLTTGLYSGDRAALQVANSTTGCWRVGNATDINMTTNAFVFLVRIRFSAVGVGGWWLSKSSNTANGYFGFGFDNSGQPSVVMRATDATAANTTIFGNIADNAWRWILVGRTVTNALAWIRYGTSQSQAAFAAAKDIGNTTAGATFMMGINLFGTPVGGAPCAISHVVCLRGAAAENVYTNRVALAANMESV